jgi:OPA family glycerol-3-phosphate transporter-like MFS transporter/OPA family sugar phosphate sensor protein UhpC-like MFS transporter
MSTLLPGYKTPVPVLPYESGEVDRAYRYWRFRILFTTIVGYALFYFVRANIGVPLKVMGDDLGYSKERLGIILSFAGVAYGISKFVNGILADRANPRYFMAAGLLCSAAMNVCFGLSSSLVFLTAFWCLNQWAQGMGFPPCAKSMAHWFSPRERNRTFGLWHTSHMIGAGLIMLLTGYLVTHYGWRSCFYVPAGIALFGVLILLIFLRDTPASLGLPPVENYKGEDVRPDEPLSDVVPAQEPQWPIVRDYVLRNPYMWVISVANFLVYFLRDVQMKWGPTFLQEAKGMTIMRSSALSTASEFAGMISALIAGYVADRYFNGRAGRVCVIAMALLAVTIYFFRLTPPGSPTLATALFIAMGFLLYIPQMLIAAMAMTLGTKRAAAAAVGLTGLLGYASSLPSGWGVGRIVDRTGWTGAFAVMIGCALGTLLLMALTWNVGAHPRHTPHNR